MKKEIRNKIELHYPVDEREVIWEQVQRQSIDYLADWRTDLGDRKNFCSPARRYFWVENKAVTQ